LVFVFPLGVGEEGKWRGVKRGFKPKNPRWGF